MHSAVTPCSEALTIHLELKPEFLVNIFPNPIESELYIQYTTNQPESMILEIFNAYGQKVFKTASNASFDDITLDVSDWASGIYFLNLKGGEMEKGIWKVLVE